MEFQSTKPIAIICLSVVTLFSLLGLLFAENIVVEDVHVGVILDMGSMEGQIILSCISTALSDFYQLHKNYTTRLLPRTKDSKGKPLHALSAEVKTDSKLVLHNINMAEKDIVDCLNGPRITAVSLEIKDTGSRGTT
ncbi:hypothetical protein ACFX15_039585 [Malus domestica]